MKYNSVSKLGIFVSRSLIFDKQIKLFICSIFDMIRDKFRFQHLDI